MSDREILEYYSKHIDPTYKWCERDGRFFQELKDNEYFKYFELAGSDILFGLQPAVEEHIKNEPIRKALKNIIENE